MRGSCSFLYKHRQWLIILFLLAFPAILYWRELTSGMLMVNGDGLIVIAKSAFEKNVLLSGTLPFWNKYVMLGTSYLADPGNGFFYPLKLLSLILNPTTYSNVFFVSSLGLGGVFTYLFINEATKRKSIAFVTAVVFLTSIFIGGCRKEHVMVYSTIIWLPLILYFILLFSSSDNRKYLIFASATMAVQFFAGFPQVSMYSFMLTFVFLIYLSANKKIKFTKLIADIIILGVFLIAFSAIQLLPSMSMIIQSGRGIADQFGLFSTNPIIGLMSLFPYVFGDIYYPLGMMSSAEVSIELYIGVIPFIYAIYALRYHYKEKFVRFFAIAAIVAFLYSSCMHIPFIATIIQKIPILNMFGVQSRILFITIFSGIVCFAFGIKDIGSKENAKQLFRFSTYITILIIFTAAVAISVSYALHAEDLNKYYRNSWFVIFGITILIALANVLFTGLHYMLLNKKKKIFKAIPYLIMALLSIITVADVWRFSKIHNSSDFEQISSTQEIQALKQLPDIENSRISVIYNFAGDYYGSAYEKSGLIDNRSMLAGIMNINGWMEFEDTAANTLLSKIESRDSSGVTRLISENNDVLSMLGIRYILCPVGDAFPYQIPETVESVLYSDKKGFDIIGDGQLFVQNYEIPAEMNRFYKIEFDVIASKDVDIEAVYVDLYGGSSFDRDDLQKHIIIEEGEHTYTKYIYTGNYELPSEPLFLRIVSVSNENIAIRNVEVSIMAISEPSDEYVKVSHTDNYDIYKNINACDLLYVVDKVVNISDVKKLLNSPESYPNMDKVSYVEGLEMESNGIINEIQIDTNSFIAIVDSKTGAFVNCAQSSQPGWKAYVDGQETKIYLVNGVIQGIYVPPGKHEVRFVFRTPFFIFGLAITAIAILFAAFFILNQRLEIFKKILGKNKQQRTY